MFEWPMHERHGPDWSTAEVTGPLRGGALRTAVYATGCLLWNVIMRPLPSPHSLSFLAKGERFRSTVAPTMI